MSADPVPHRSPHLRSVGLALFVTVLWSSSWILIRCGLDSEDLDPIGFAALRYSVAAIILAGWLLSRRDRRAEVRSLEGADLRRIMALGVALYGLTQGAQFVAIDNQTASTTNLMLATTSLVVAVVSGRLLSERPSARQFVGGVVVIVGAVLFFNGSLEPTTVGMIAATVGLVANADGALLGRQVNRDRRLSATTVQALGMSTSAALLLLAALAFEGVPSVSWRATLIVTWLAAMNTALAFALWNVSLRGLSAVESSGINTTMLPQIGILAWVFLDEAPGWL
ncbi:MAG: DMT family transporter, partial [Actinomycetota bacterium]|nr:DMT family transporter [Actinomycetota bacterium]